MKVKKGFKQFAALVLAAIFFTTSIAIPEYPQVYAATMKINTWGDNQVICGKKAALELPGSWKKCRIISSDKQIATVNRKGTVTAKKLGVTTITVKYKNKKSKYSVTVVPKKKSDISVVPGIIFFDQKVKPRLVSDKYDTSRVKLCIDDDDLKTADGDGSIICENKGEWSNWSFPVYCHYGSYNFDSNLDVFDQDSFLSTLLGIDYYNLKDSTSGFITGIDAGAERKISLSKFNKKYTLALLGKKGVSVNLDGRPISDTETFTPGSHELTVSIDGLEAVKRDISVSYSVEDTLTKMDATGWPDDCKSVFDAAFDADRQVVKDGMSDRDKLLAIHDYLIYHANYVNNGDYSTAANWAAGATGVLQHQEGICQSYAFAFYMMARAEGFECRFVCGGNHACNKVKVDGKWYYVDCTWDDPVGGGYEHHKYFMSESLWPDHTYEKEDDLAINSSDCNEYYNIKYNWMNLYLTGKGY